MTKVEYNMVVFSILTKGAFIYESRYKAIRSHSRREMKLHRMLRNQRKKGKVTGINRIPNSTKIEKYLKRVSKRLES